MAAAYALAIFSGIVILISRLSHSAECSKRYFYKWGRRGKQHLQSESAILSIRLLSVKMQIRTARRLSSARRRYNLPRVACLVSGANRCSVSSVRAAVCPGTCLLWFWHGLRCYLCRVAVPGALGAVVSASGVYGASRGVGRSTPRVEKIQKRRSLPTNPLFSAQNVIPPIVNLKNSAQKQKDPYKGSVFCAILALQALKRRNLQWLKVK